MVMTADGLAKLVEETGELLQVIGKKLAYFNTDTHPDGAGSLSVRMEQEIADVAAASQFVVDKFHLNKRSLAIRKETKLDIYEMWHNDVSNSSDGFQRPKQKHSSEGDKYIGMKVADLPKESTTKRFFSYSPTVGFNLHDTAEEARNNAESEIDKYRKDVTSDGYWIPEVEEVRWGVVNQIAEGIPASDGSIDYKLG